MTASKTTFPPVKEQMDVLLRGIQEVITAEELEQKLERSCRSGVPLTIKQGFDPSAPDLHLGHAVTIRKLRQFQDLGHRVIFLIGDFTGMVGDPSGRSKTRPRLTREDVTKNARTYEEQVFKILDRAKTEIRFNSEWHGKRDVYQFLELAGKHTVARMLERDDFLKRYQSGEPISILEFLYPLLQAYDSVALRADVEMGGSDQKYNLLLGRKIQEEYGLEPQVAFMMPLLVGTDGKEKMSKSLGNYVGINDPPEEIYGRILSIPDELIARYFLLTTDLPEGEIEAIRKDVESRNINPMIHKQRLAREIVAQYHSPEAARRAEEDFLKRFRYREIPENVPEITISDAPEKLPINHLLVKANLSQSLSEARRDIQSGSVKLDGEKILDFRQEIHLKSGQILQVGKRRIVRLILQE